MAGISVERYSSDMCREWNATVASSRNGTFLFNRGYMDYHAVRFTDHSLIFLREGKIIAMLPANIVGDILFSHQGLTYGGVILSPSCKGGEVMEIFSSLVDYLKVVGIKRVQYKPVPHIYHTRPSEEELYALFKNGAHLVGRSLSSVLIPSLNIPFVQLRCRGVKRALESGVEVCREDDFMLFWEILSANLMERHSIKPVHSLEEIELLKSRFPDNIHLYTAVMQGDLQAGVVVYETLRCIHVQYIATSPSGRKTGALDMLFSYLIKERYKDAAYFDFGISTESAGSILNTGLLSQKEGFGAGGAVYDTYELSL